MQRGRHRLVPHRHDHLDDPGHASRGLRVAHVRLDRAEPHRRVDRATLPVGGQQGLRLDGIAQRRAGAVALDDVDVGRSQARVGERGAHHALLRGAVGCGQPVRRTVLIDRRTGDHREHRMSEALRVREPFDDENATAVGESGAVGCTGEGFAAAVGRQSALPAELDEDVRRGVDRDAAGQREIALAEPERLHRHVQCGQRRRAGGVDRDGRALEAEHVGDTSGRDAGCLAGQAEALGVRSGRAGDHAVPLGDDAGENSGGAAAQSRRIEAATFQCLPGQFEEQPLLRVHRQRLTGRDTEEACVEIRCLSEEATRARIRLAGCVGVSVEELGDVPPAVGGEVREHVAPVGDHPPQVFRRGHPAGVAAGHPDDGDGLVDHGSRRGRLDRCRRRGPGQLGPDVAGQRVRGGVIEDERG